MKKEVGDTYEHEVITIESVDYNSADESDYKLGNKLKLYIPYKRSSTQRSCQLNLRGNKFETDGRVRSSQCETEAITYEDQTGDLGRVQKCEPLIIA